MHEPHIPAHKRRNDLTRQTLTIFWQHAKVYWPLLLLCALGILFLIGCDLLSPIFYKRFFDLLALDPLHQAQRGSMKQLNTAIVLIGLAALGSWLGWRFCMYAVNQFETRVMKDLTDYCFEYLQNHSYRFFTDNFAGALVKRVNRFAAAFETIGDQCTLQLGQVVIRVTLIIGVLFWRNTTIGWVFLAWTGIFVCFNVFFSRWKLKFDMHRAETDTKVTARLSDTISNSINLKLFAAIHREVRDFREITNEHRRARYLSWKLAERSDYIQGLSVRVLEILVLVMAVRYWLRDILTLGDFILLRAYLYQLVDRVREVGQSVRRVYEAMADANEMTEILLAPHEVRDADRAATLEVSSGTVEFRDVHFSYIPGGNLVLKDFNLKTKTGERVGIVGPSGGGKSTILKLLVRLYDLNDGAILIDHQSIRSVTQSSLHENIAYVPQEPILFHRTLMENIRYSRPEAADGEVIHAAKLAHCHEFISNFAASYETLVGERGIKLSGGERQRVAIARAILMNAPILLLDEATSSLDSESEMYIQDALAKLIVGRTVIAVAHRLSTIRKMDRIVVVKNGRIVEEGSHDLLVKIENGVYQRLWNLQSVDLGSGEEPPGYIQ
jgi:ATP-binding cassette subfamily B protein